MLLNGNRQSFSRLFITLGGGAAALALLAASTQGKGPDRLGARDDWDALPCQMQSIEDPEEGQYGVAESPDIDGDVAISGRCVFRFDGTEWQIEAVLPHHGDALSGPVIVVGAKDDDQMGESAGTAYVYRYDGAEWALEAQLFASDAQPFDRFGRSTDVDGDVMVIGADEYEFYEQNPGSAYVFRYIDGQWIETAKLLASDGQIDDCFGFRVRIEDNRILVGNSEGEIYYFKHDGDTWTELQKLTRPEGADPWDWASFEFSDNHLIVGNEHDEEYGEYAGAAFGYDLVDETWVFRQKLVPQGIVEMQKFGIDVSISGDTALIGSVGLNWEEQYVSAWAYVFRLTDGSWQEVTRLDGDGPMWWEFGKTVALDGDHAIVGAPLTWATEIGKVFFHAGMTGGDCNNNGIADGCDIFLGTSEDFNENGIPDECECPGDFDGDGDIDTADLLFLLGAWGTPDGDVDFDGDTDTADLLALLGAWGECP